MRLKGFQITRPAVFVGEGILVETTLFGSGTNQAALGDEFDVDLHPPAEILHLFIRLRDIFWIWQFHCHLTAFAQKAVQSRDRACAAP